jgi:hypothetical protein
MPIHSISRCSNTLYTSNMDVGCSQWGFAASTMTPQHHIGLAIPRFPSNPHPPAHVIRHKCAPKFPSTASQGDQTLCICEDIPRWKSLCCDSAFAHKKEFSVFKFPKRFSEFSWAKRSLYSLYSFFLYLLY